MTYHYSEIMKSFKAGDRIWACAFKLTEDVEGNILKCSPIYGEFCVTNKAKIEAEVRKTKDRPLYFVPFGSKGNLVWSRAVQVSSRRYADTEEECIALYNEEIQYYVEFFENRIKMVKAEILPEKS